MGIRSARLKPCPTAILLVNMRDFVQNRILGSISTAMSLVSLAVFYLAYIVAGYNQSLLQRCLIAGKAACVIASIAVLAAIVGVFTDRRKLLAVAAILLGWLSLGWIGMFVYNI
jgi:hypothetical protein